MADACVWSKHAGAAFPAILSWSGASRRDLDSAGSVPGYIDLIILDFLQ